MQGIYLHEGWVYINAEFVSIVNLVAQSIVSVLLASTDSSTYFNLDNAILRTEESVFDEVHGVELVGGMIRGTQRAADGDPNFNTAMFQLYNSLGNVFFVSVNGAPISIFSDGGVKLGTEDAPLYLGGKRVGWVTNSDGQTFTLVGM